MFKKFMMMMAAFSVVILVNAQDEVKDVTDNIKEAANDVQDATAGDKAAEVSEINAEEKAKEKQVNDVDKKLEKTAEEASGTVKKDIAEDKALGEAEAEEAKKKAEAELEEVPEPSVAEEKGSSWFGWLWPFGGSDKTEEAEEAKEATPAPAVEEKPAVAAVEAPVEKPVVAEEAPVAEPAAAEEAPAEKPAVAAEEKVEEGSSWFGWLWPFGGSDKTEEAVEEKPAVAAVEAPVEKPVVAEEAPVAEPAVAEKAPAVVETAPPVAEKPEVIEQPAVAAEEKVEEGSSWFGWLWPFGGDDKADKTEEAVEEKPAVAAEEAPVEKPVVAEEAPVAEPAVAEEAPAEEPKVAAEKGEGIDYMHKILYYFPNVLLDLTDIFSISLGVGAESGLRIGATRWCQFGGNYGDTYFLEKGYKRQVGGGYNDGYIGQLGPLAIEKRYIDKTIGNLHGYIMKNDNAYIPRPTDAVYAEEIRDFWEIGVEGGWLLKFDFQIHPVEFADFLTGLFFIDICEDEL